MFIDTAPPSSMHISDQGIVFVMGKEGKANVAYQDIGGVWTICVGAIKDKEGKPVKKGLRYSDQDCLELLGRDVGVAEKAIQQCVTTPLYQNQFDALTSLTFNIGNTAFCKSTLVRVLNQGRLSEASMQFKKWTYVKGVFSPGLYSRRVSEEALFLQGKY